MDLSGFFSTAVLVVAGFMTLWYLASLILKDASIVDIAWGLGFVVLSWVFFVANTNPDAGHTVLTFLVSLWGVRLATHIYRRKHGAPEDWRYAKWRKDWGKNFFWRSFFQIFMLQGVLMLIIASPVWIAAANDTFELSVALYLGALTWCIGFFFEAVGDSQLTNFIKEKKTRKNGPQVMTRGLWSYTRHPNYFGEVTQWWGIFIIVCTLNYGWLAVMSPLAITYLLLKVSGITLLEKKYEGDKEFKAYKLRTSAFFPLPPKK